eukprot:CAMPEP_0115542394 /NCGR_PEP_ID=MMETSP0271-20121206/90964_1 /TAXON_ID=71861 /ORGANISM="Scrippsiella trochoidea, Strain CCMP3099" /LENGTH=57 /DNA_ID=CAMNT_0002975505 /DNA_START=59 /DNA_END=229 /DNA_ORIENTATION=-
MPRIYDCACYRMMHGSTFTRPPITDFSRCSASTAADAATSKTSLVARGTPPASASRH